MNIPTDTLPTEGKQTLQQLIHDTGGPTARPYATLIGLNMGSNTLLLSLPMQQFYEISEVANEQNINEKAYLAGEEVAQRKLDKHHATALAIYIIKGLFHAKGIEYAQRNETEPSAFQKLRARLGTQPYMALQPITANIRACGPQGAGLNFDKDAKGRILVYLTDLHLLWVIDGQHRRYAMHLVNDFLKDVTLLHKYPRKPALIAIETDEEKESINREDLAVWNGIFELWRTRCTVMVETHLGLKPEQERQLFHDLNNLTKKLETGLALSFDNSNPINVYIKETLESEGVLTARVVEKDIADWHSDPGAISRKDLIAVNAVLFLNKTNIRSATPSDLQQKRDIATRFWEAVSEIPGFGEPEARQKTVAAQPVVLKAIAKLTFDFAFGRSRDISILETLLSKLQTVDFSHSNPMWRFYELPEGDRETTLPGLAAYLPSSEGANRDIGAYNPTDSVMRFGAKHNDIFPILGDMLRWKMGLPNRHVSG